MALGVREAAEEAYDLLKLPAALANPEYERGDAIPNIQVKWVWKERRNHGLGKVKKYHPRYQERGVMKRVGVFDSLDQGRDAQSSHLVLLEGVEVLQGGDGRW